MSINNLPNDVVKHEIMTYIKPKYEVWEVSYIQIETKVDYSDDDEIELETTENVRTGLFKISEKEKGYEFNPFNCYMSAKTLCRMNEIRKNGEIATFHKYRVSEEYSHTTFVYISHTLVCS